MLGRITKILSNNYTVDNKYVCNARGKFRNIGITPLVGDICEFNSDSKYILDILKRKNELKRPPISNVDIALIVTSMKDPELSLNTLDKLITSVLLNNIEPVICFTKLDLMTVMETREYKVISRYYEGIGIKVINNKNLFKLKKMIKNKLIVLCGQSGVGKSSLINKLNKKLKLETSPLSKSLKRGIHTTRCVELFSFGGGFIADTPGFSALDFKDISKTAIKDTFREFKQYKCAFKDCNHLNEENCGVKEALKKNKILPSRYINYVSLMK